jgi:tetratricopeptide (TPR) repeat protein
MQPVILDTDVASLLHRGKLTGPLATRLIGREPLITFITFGELAKWAEIRRWGTHRRGELAAWLSGCLASPSCPAMRPSPPSGAACPQPPCYFSLGDYRQAIDLCTQGLEIARDIGDRYGEANELDNLGRAWLASGDAGRAVILLSQAVKIADITGDIQPAVEPRS